MLNRNMGGMEMNFTPADNHDFKITKEQAGIYFTCCGDEVRFYTSVEFGLPASEGWYITQPTGAFNGDRFLTLAEVKTFLIKYHTKQTTTEGR